MKKLRNDKGYIVIARNSVVVNGEIRKCVAANMYASSQTIVLQ